MRVPNSQHAHIDRAKLLDYLLSPVHRRGRAKYRFFLRLGYTRGDWMRLADDLKAHLRRHAIVHGEMSTYGVKYVVRGSVRGPTGAVANVVAVWIILPAEDFPRFVTAYPGGRS